MKKQKKLSVLAIALSFIMLFSNITYTVENTSTEVVNNGAIIITEFMPLDQGVSYQEVDYNTQITELNLPNSLNISGYIQDENILEPESKSIIIDNINWTSSKEFNGDVGEYIFTPELGSYIVETITIPSIRVTVIENKEDTVVEETNDASDIIDKSTVITEFLPLDKGITNQVVAYNTPIDMLTMPDTLNVNGYVNDGTTEKKDVIAMTINSTKWNSSPEYNENIGVYTFTPDLSGYILEDNNVPSITITVEEIQEENNEEIIKEITDDTTEEVATTEKTINEEIQNGTFIITQFNPLDKNVINQTVPYDTVIEDLLLPSEIKAYGYIYDDRIENPKEEIVTISDIVWTAKSTYLGETGQYIFTPSISGYVIEGIVPTITVNVEEQLNKDMMDDEIDLEIMRAGLEENPDPLTLEDLSNYEIQQQTFTQSPMPMRMSLFAIPEKHPNTIIIGSDNNNNSHTGVSDNDIDANMSSWKSNYPIEVSFTLNELPAESAYIAIKALDVDEEAGEMDYVFINDAPASAGVAGNSIGALSGNNNVWNTTVIKIPLSKLRLGENYVTITVSPHWYTTIDWIQLILDGGQEDENVSDFSITLDDAIQNGNNVEITSSVNIVQNGTTEYYTEYILTNSNGENISTYFGSATSNEVALLSMPLDSPSGDYTVTGLIKDKVTETIKARDEIKFNFVQGEVPMIGLDISHNISPAYLTNGNVDIQLSATNKNPDEITNVGIWYEGGDITGNLSGNTTIANQSVTTNGTYEFTFKYALNGIQRFKNYSVDITNIDKVSPVIVASNITVLEETTDEDVLNAIDRVINVTDNLLLPKNPYSLSMTNNFSNTLEDKTVTITATDVAGNESTKDITVSITPKPIELIQNNVALDEGALSASLSATLNYTGGYNNTESGFVWGVSQNPTYEVCNGKVSINGTVGKGESFNTLVENIVEGINYYARAYIKLEDTYYYSEQKSFSIGAPEYGTFSVTTDVTDVDFNGGTATFTISRPSDKTEGRQTVYYRTVNGTAIGSVHFVNKMGTLVFEEGEHTKTIDVTVNGISREYNANPATAYQNSKRNFYLEIYKVEGGATIATSFSKKNIALDNLKKVYAESYNQYNLVGNTNYTQKFLRDHGFSNNSKDTVTFTSVHNTDTGYLDDTANLYALKFSIDVKEDDDGYQMLRVISNGNQIYYNEFEHDAGKWNSTEKRYTFPMTDAEARGVMSSSRVNINTGNFADNNKAISIGKNKTVNIEYDSRGDGDDDWYKDDFEPYIRVIDTVEPQLIGVAPMTGGTYNYGDEVYVSLVFNEIIGSISGVTINTNLSDTPFTYVEGVGTNVLVFKGTIDKEGLDVNSITVNTINQRNSIKDLSNDTGTDTADVSDGTGIDANTNRPTISFAGSSEGTLPKHEGVVTVGSSNSTSYTWTQSIDMPLSGWMNFDNSTGGTLTETLANDTNGTVSTWYLHVLATHENGNTRWQYKEFKFQLPTMNVSVDNTNWSQSRNIQLDVTNNAGAPVSVSMTGPISGTYTNSELINVNNNGDYTFTLTDNYGSNIVKTVSVSKLDSTKPNISINEYNDTEAVYNSLDFGISAIDEENGSGLSSLQYKWTNDATVPADGWLGFAGGSLPTYSEVGIAYLHVKAVDNAGNISYACSKGYTIINNNPPTIEVNGGALVDWQSESVTLNYTVNKTDGNIIYIDAGGTVLENGTLPGIYPFSSSLDVRKNGLYTFTVIDENGLTDTKSIVVNYIDSEAPTITLSYDVGQSVTSYEQSKNIRIDASDNGSPVVDIKGNIINYGGSGVNTIEWKKGMAGTYNSINNGDVFLVDENAIYYIRVTDVVGNSTEYNVNVTGIDITVPTVNVSTPVGYINSNYEATLTYSDNYSGIETAKYAISNNKTEIPIDLLDMPTSGSSITITNEGSNYIYYRVIDKAGNISEGWSDIINIDKTKPVIESIKYKIIGDENELDFILGNNLFTQPIRVVVNVTDNLSEPKSINYSYNGINDTVSINENGIATFDIGLNNEGTLTIEAEDKAGNNIVNDTSYNITIENNSPVIEVIGNITESSSDVWQNQVQTVTVNVDDSPNGEVSSSLDNINIVVKRWDGTAYTEEIADYSHDYIDISGLVPTSSINHDIVLNTSGKYKITIDSLDCAGNTSQTIIKYINIDITNPDNNPILMLDGIEVISGESHQESNYTVGLDEEIGVNQSSIKAQYKLNNDTNINNNVLEWTDVPIDNSISILEGMNTIELRTIDLAENVSEGVTYIVTRDNTLPIINEITPINESVDQSITPNISFKANEELQKGNGYLTLYDGETNKKIVDIHSSNNRIKLSEDKKTVNISLPIVLEKNKTYYIKVDEGFVMDSGNNKLAVFGGKDLWSFKTVENPIIPDDEIVILGYTVEMISKAGADANEISQTLGAISDKEEVKQHNIIAKANYTENGVDYYLKLKVTPILSATPSELSVSTTKGSATLSSNGEYIDVLIPKDSNEADVTISLGDGVDNQFVIKIINSSYKALVETSDGVVASADESNLLNSVDLSKEYEADKLPNTSVDVTLKLAIDKKEDTEIPSANTIKDTIPEAKLIFLDITIEKIVKTTVDGVGTTTESEIITDTQEPITVTIELPDDLRGRYSYQIVREHNGIIDILPATVVEDGTKLQFKTNRFSTYSIAYVQIPVSSSSVDTKISSVIADSNLAIVNLDNVKVDDDIEVGSLVPYYIQDGKEIIVPFSVSFEGELKWLAEKDIKYFFKTNTKEYTDIEEHWAKDNILFVTSRDLFKGMGNNEFSPNTSITRGMFVTVLCKLWNIDVSEYNSSSFTDVNKSEWYHPYIEWAKEANIISGYGNELFGPNDVITREQMALITYNFIKYTQLEVEYIGQINPFNDIDTINEWAVDAVDNMRQAGIINGKPNNIFDPKDTATRAEAATVIKLLIENVMNKK